MLIRNKTMQCRFPNIAAIEDSEIQVKLVHSCFNNL